MNVANRQKSVFITVDEENQYALADYSIYKHTTSGCVETIPIMSGVTDEMSSAEIELQDGVYTIVVVGAEDLVDITHIFSVYYNNLPNLLRNTRKVLCDSDSCVECDGDKNLMYYFYETILYLNATGLICRLQLVSKLLNTEFIKMSDAKLYEKYYGEYKYNYDYAIKKFFAYLCAEFYYEEYNLLRYENYTQEDVKKMFSLDIISKCAYNSDIDFNEILCGIEKLNCNCDG